MQTLMNLGAVVGLDLRRLIRTVGRFPRFVGHAMAYRRAARSGRFPLRVRNLRPFLLDFDSPAGAVSGHYFYQDLWAARRIFVERPAAHVDVGSRIDGFVAHLLSFMPVTVVDVRPLTDVVAGLTFVQADATTLDAFEDDSAPSLSSLHAIEHFGLGRYADAIDPDAPFKALHSLRRILAPGGRLYLSVPVGTERLEFNGQRVFAPSTIIEGLPGLELISMAAVLDSGEFRTSLDLKALDRQRYACGMFEFQKPHRVGMSTSRGENQIHG